MSWPLIIFLTLFNGSIICGFIWQRNNEKRCWNNGVCSECGEKWRFFDEDSQGGRGYKCGCVKRIWITYNVDGEG